MWNETRARTINSTTDFLEFVYLFSRINYLEAMYNFHWPCHTVESYNTLSCIFTQVILGIKHLLLREAFRSLCSCLLFFDCIEKRICQRRHSVGAMPCRGLLAAKTQLCVFVCVYHTLTVRFKVPQGFLRLPKVPQGYIHMVPLGNPRLLKVN